MPRKALIDSGVILDKLQQCEKCQVFDEDYKLKCRTDKVWEEVCIKICDKLSPNTLNFYVRNNRWNLLTDLKKHFQIPIEDEEKDEAMMDSIDVSNVSNISQDFVPHNNANNTLPSVFFDITLSEEQWKSISPVSKIYKEKGTRGKCYKILSPGWTDIICKASFLKTKIPCAYTFKYSKIFDSPEAETYLKIYGTCNECGAEFKAHCLHEPAPGTGIVLRVHTVDASGIPHEKKRAVKGKNRVEIGKQLLNIKPRQWRNDAVSDLSYDDPEPPYVARQCTLRKIREEAIVRELGINKNLDPINSLCELKCKGQYSGYIKQIAKDPFYCFYWSPMQMEMYKTLIKSCRKIEIDATGKLVKIIEKLNGDKKHIFLYQIIIKGANGIQPIFQMLSEKHDTNLITYWLREIIRDGAPVPPEVDSDYSLALLNATSLAFNERCLKNYISDCYRWITSEILQHPLRCFIRIDIAHLIKIICSKDVFHRKHPKIKDFFVRCAGIMSSCDNVEDFRTLLSSIFIVAYSEYDGKDSDGNEVICEQKRSYLFERIKSFTFTSDENATEYDDLEMQNENENIVAFVNNIRDEAEQIAKDSVETDRYNAFYCPELVTYLVKLAKHFPLWTQVMRGYFPLSSNVATSSRCEAYFKDLKHSDLGANYKPMRVDKFIIHHIKSIENISKLERAAIKRTNEKIALLQIDIRQEKERKIDSRDFDENAQNTTHTYGYLTEQENWKGLNIEAKPNKLKHLRLSNNNRNYIEEDENKENVKLNIIQKPLIENKKNTHRGKYLTSCPDIHLTYDRPLRKRKDEILRNGNNCNLVHLNGEKIYIQNTCAFDALVEVLTSAYCNYSTFKNWIDENSDNIFFMFVKKYAMENINNSVYEERGAILCTIFENCNNIVDCTTNVNELFTRLVTDICSVEENRICGKCQVKSSKLFVVDLISTPTTEDFKQNFDNFVAQYFSVQTRTCKTCQSALQLKREPKSYVFIDTEIFFQINKINEILLNSIPEKFQIEDALYVLSGIVCHSPGHYTAYCRNTIGAWTVHNDISQKLRKISNKKTLKVFPTTMIFIKDIKILLKL